MDETDLFFNLRLGEIVLSTGRVPTENLLSFTHPEATDVNLAWLFQILLALVHRAGGISGTVLLKTAFVLGTWTVLFRVALHRGAHPVAAALALALAAWAAEPRFVERPHLVTFLGLALVLLALERAEAGRRRLLWGMVPAGLVWANANSCYFLAPVLLLLYAAGAFRDGLGRQARQTALVALAMLPLTVATPSGLGVLSYVANHVRMPYLRPLQEYRHAQWPLDGPFFFLVGGLALAWLAPRVVRGLAPLIPARVLLPCAALGVLGGLRIRFVAELAMLAGPGLAVAATRAAAGIAKARLVRWGTPAGAALLVGLALAPRLSAASSGGRVFDLGLEPELVPFAAIDFVERHGLRERMYNDLEVGSYLCWRGWPRHRVFQDPRINGYPEAFHAVLRRPDLTRAEWQGFLDGFGVTAALVTFPSLNPRGALFEPARWALVYRAEDGLVFARRPLPDGLAELPLTFSYSGEEGLSPVPMATPPPDAKVSPCDWRRSLGDHHRLAAEKAAALAEYEGALANDGPPACLAAAREAGGALALELGDAAKAAYLLEGAASVVARTNHGFALLALGRAADALAELDAVLAEFPGNDEATFGRGLALVAQGREREAANAFEALLARAPGHVSAAAARRELGRLRARLARE